MDERAETLLKDPNFVAYYKKSLAAKAYKASQNIFEFFEFVMEEETTRKPIKLAPHQRLMLEFMMAHDRCVIMLPIGTSKTYTTAGLALYFLGKDPTLRGAIVSATQLQAQKPLGMVSDYIRYSQRLKMVFPKLIPSMRQRDFWTQSSITVDRPAGIRDASLMALGVDGAIAGSRLNWILVDDIHNRENSATKEQRDKVYSWFDSSVLSRLDPRNARIIVSNSPWHQNDLLHRLQEQGWPILRMEILGNIYVQDDAERIAMSLPPWDSDLIRPAKRDPEAVRLVAHGEDPEEATPLWPQRYPAEHIEKLRKRHLPHEFNRLYMTRVRDDDTARCKLEWIELCKMLARKEGIYSMVSKYEGPNITFTGVDLAVSPGEEHDDTAFFTFEIRPDGHRVILDVEIGQFDGPTIVDKIFEKHRQYNSVIRVENNGSQDFILQFARQKNISIPIKAHTTGRAKAHPEFGVESLFLEFQNGAWLIPNDKHGQCHPMIQAFIEACLYYSPSKHTADVLMSAYFSREQAREWGVLSGSDTADNSTSSMIGMSILAR